MWISIAGLVNEHIYGGKEADRGFIWMKRTIIHQQSSGNKNRITLVFYKQFDK